MKTSDSILNTDRLNYLNIGLMLLACGVAFFVPFELFLFAYAVLGPGHYLTEISWLHERKYFSKGKYDFVFLGLSAIALFITGYVLKPQGILDANTSLGFSTALVYVAFAAALAMVVLKTPFQRFIAVLIILISALATRNATILFSVFLPTLIHVYVFTGLFILYGALKGRSRSGYVSFGVFLLCPLLFFVFQPDPMPITTYGKEAYKSFEILNVYLLKLWDGDMYAFPAKTLEGFNQLMSAIYNSSIGITFMRFIAFAYTYHYLNWFSKTTVIKWHQVSKTRLVVIGALWIGAVAFYAWDYKLGFNVLFLISFLHVFLEFPLNHVSMIGIVTELRTIWGGKPAVAPVQKGKKK